MIYQPGYAITRDTWCPLTENNWITIPDNPLKISPSVSSLPLHIQMECALLYEKPFNLVLNPKWFINYAGILTFSVSEATYGYYLDPIWKIVIPSTDNTADSDYYQTTIIFIDMKSNSSFTINNKIKYQDKILYTILLLLVICLCLFQLNYNSINKLFLMFDYIPTY